MRLWSNRRHWKYLLSLVRYECHQTVLHSSPRQSTNPVPKPSASTREQPSASAIMPTLPSSRMRSTTALTALRGSSCHSKSRVLTTVKSKHLRPLSPKRPPPLNKARALLAHDPMPANPPILHPLILFIFKLNSIPLPWPQKDPNLLTYLHFRLYRGTIGVGSARSQVRQKTLIIVSTDGLMALERSSGGGLAVQLIIRARSLQY